MVLYMADQEIKSKVQSSDKLGQSCGSAAAAGAFAGQLMAKGLANFAKAKLPSTDNQSKSNAFLIDSKDTELNRAARTEPFDTMIRRFSGKMYSDPNSGYTVVVKDTSLKLDGERQFSPSLINQVFIIKPDSKEAVQVEIRGEGGRSYYDSDGKYVITAEIDFSTSDGKARLTTIDDKGTLFDTKGNVIATLTCVSPEEQKNVDAKITYKELPEAPQVEYFASLEDGRFVCVTSPRYNYSYEGFRVFLGKPGDMKELEVKQVDRYSDGGTTYISTDRGRLFFPFRREPASFALGEGVLPLQLMQADVVVKKELGIQDKSIQDKKLISLTEN